MTAAETQTPGLPGRARPFPVDGALRRLVDVINALGGRPIAVGGAVRDHLLGIPAKDVDVEVHGVALEPLEAALTRAFEVHAVGRSFGVLKVGVEAGGVKEVFDVSLPRTESKTGRGHKGFVVQSAPDLGFAAAAARRDFTINALGVDLVDGALLDPWGGVADLEAGVLRHVSAAFDEDPLRVLRACQIAARFGLEIAAATLERCHALGPELPTLPVERVWEELKKLLLKAPWPSVGLCALDATGAIALFPELKALQGCPQEPEWHPEGDVWIHTLLVVDEAARISRHDRLGEEEALGVILGALCHDLGKPATTELLDGRVRSRDHESQGELPTRAFLARLGAPPALVEQVVPLVREHLKPHMLWRDREKVSDSALRRLALRVPIPQLVRVANADFLGRTTPEALAGDDPACRWLLDEAVRLHVNTHAPSPLLQGRHLLARGIAPGPAVGVLLKEAFEAQLEGRFHDVDSGLAWLDARLAGAPA